MKGITTFISTYSIIVVTILILSIITYIRIEKIHNDHDKIQSLHTQFFNSQRTSSAAHENEYDYKNISATKVGDIYEVDLVETIKNDFGTSDTVKKLRNFFFTYNGLVETNDTTVTTEMLFECTGYPNPGGTLDTKVQIEFKAPVLAYTDDLSLFAPQTYSQFINTLKSIDTWTVKSSKPFTMSLKIFSFNDVI